jgi:hypothetical protein
MLNVERSAKISVEAFLAKNIIKKNQNSKVKSQKPAVT